MILIHAFAAEPPANHHMFEWSQMRYSSFGIHEKKNKKNTRVLQGMSALSVIPMFFLLCTFFLYTHVKMHPGCAFVVYIERLRAFSTNSVKMKSTCLVASILVRRLLFCWFVKICTVRDNLTVMQSEVE